MLHDTMYSSLAKIVGVGGAVVFHASPTPPYIVEYFAIYYSTVH